MDRLEQEFGRDNLFMDVDTIPLGTDFVRVLRDEVGKCDVLLAVIGPRWFDARDDAGNRRLEIPKDFVRIEIAAALQRGISVIPILLDGARLPKADQLPDDLKDLVLRNALDVRHASFRSDMDRLIRSIKAEEKDREARRELQRTVGGRVTTKLQWIDKFYRCCAAIARIAEIKTGDPAGTGFLMSGADICPDWRDEPVFLTNSHILSSNPDVDLAPLLPSQADVEFTRVQGRPRARLGELVYYSPRTELDVSIFRIVAPPEALFRLECCTTLPKISNASVPRVWVVGHAMGMELSFSLEGLSVAECSEQFVRYQAPVEKDSTGAPVLDRELKCVAIHHRVFRERQLAEGVVLEAVVRAIAQHKS
jgi:hypothetical protein